MSMPHFVDQQIGGTVEDSQGECLPLQVLRDYVAYCDGKRLPLGRRHDPLAQSAGYIENVRIVDHQDFPGEHALIADVYCDASSLEENLKGFSISFTEVIERPKEASEIIAYLPFPHYQDEELRQSLINQSPPVTVGKWVKKSHDLNTVALIGSGILWVLAPVWSDYYKTHIAPKINDFVKKNLDAFRKLSIDSNFVQMAEINGHQFQVLLIPDRGKQKTCLSPEYLDQAMNEVHVFVFAEKAPEQIERISMHFESESVGYKIHSVQSISGQIKYYC
jgi:hypothetical protein